MELTKLLDRYELFIIDMDGTLYYQSELRVKMLAMMFRQFFTNRSCLRELYAVYSFRKLREGLAGKAYDDTLLYKKVAEGAPGFLRSTANEVEAAVAKWIYDMPLPVLRGCRDERLVDFVNAAAAAGKLVYIYSDYPVEKKAKAIGIVTDAINFIDASDERVYAYKPSPKGIEYILDATHAVHEAAVMIGDRDDRDGQAAELAGVDALILSKKKSQRYKDV